MLEWWLICELTKSQTLKVVDYALSFEEMQTKLDKKLREGKHIYAIRTFC